MPMPYFLSSEGYGIFLPTDHYTEFDLCSTEEDSWKMEAETEGSAGTGSMEHLRK